MRLRRRLAPAAVLLAACIQEPTIPTVAEAPIALTMAFSTKAFRVGKADTISVTATSTFTAPARLLFATDCQIQLTIRSARGAAVVPPGGRPTCSGAASALLIPAKGTVTQRFVWTGLDQVLPTASTTTVAPGTYYVSAAINATNYSTVAPAVKVDLLAR